MNGQTTNYGRRIAGMIMTLLILVTAGIGVTSAAAKSAIPGDALYQLKTTVEQTRLTLARDAGDRAVAQAPDEDRCHRHQEHAGNPDA